MLYIKHPDWCTHCKYIFILTVTHTHTHTHNTFLYNLYCFATSFGPESGPSSGHYTRTRRCIL